MKEVKLIYIGDKFYCKSGTLMSSIYTEDGERFDWGFVNVALEEGKEVHIRPADDAELAIFEARLKNINRGKNETNSKNRRRERKYF